MKISKEARRISRELFKVSLVDGKLDAKTISSLTDRLLSEKPRDYGTILREYTRLIRLEVERRSAVVESAADLSAEESASIQKDLASRFGSDLAVSFRTNPTLLGGLRIKVGDDVWDGSIAARLASLSSKF